MSSPLAAALVALELAQDAPATAEEVAACGDNPSLVCTAVLEWTDNDVLAKAADVFVAKPLMIAFIVAVAFVLNRLARRAIRRFVLSFEQPGMQQRIGSLRNRTPSALLTTGPVPPAVRPAGRDHRRRAAQHVHAHHLGVRADPSCWGELGINLGPLIAGAGIAGVALGFGAQTLVRDFLTGMFMLIEDQFGVGDIIDVGDASGVVEGVSLRTTRLRDVEGTVWHVPNGEIKRVANKSQQWSRALIDFDVAYATDLDLAKRVIKETAVGVWRDPRARHLGAGGARGVGGGALRARRRGHPPGGQDPSGRPVEGDARAAPADEGGLRRQRHRDPVPAAHHLGAPRRGRTRPPGHARLTPGLGEPCAPRYQIGT